MTKLSRSIEGADYASRRAHDHGIWLYGLGYDRAGTYDGALPNGHWFTGRAWHDNTRRPDIRPVADMDVAIARYARCEGDVIADDTVMCDIGINVTLEALSDSGICRHHRVVTKNRAGADLAADECRSRQEGADHQTAIDAKVGQGFASLKIGQRHHDGRAVGQPTEFAQVENRKKAKLALRDVSIRDKNDIAVETTGRSSGNFPREASQPEDRYTHDAHVFWSTRKW